IDGFLAVNDGSSVLEYARLIASGLLLPTLPSGAWSITVELHYYLFLPLILAASRKTAVLLPGVVILGIVMRVALFLTGGEVQTLSYWTIIGRIDQFALGMLLCRYRARFRGRHWVVALILGCFALFYWNFDRA